MKPSLPSCFRFPSLLALMGAAFFTAPALIHADPINADLSGYKAVSGLTAAVANNGLVVIWEGDNNAELRMRFAIESGAPVVQELAIKPKGGAWRTLATNMRPEFRVVSGLRRITQQQLRPDSIQALGGKVSPKVNEMYRKNEEWVDQAVSEGQIKKEDVERWKWEAFWDSPLYVEGSGVRPPSHGTSIPPLHGIFGQPGLPRKPEEITRATASYKATGCEVKTNGQRLEITFPGVELGVFSGKLEYDIFKGSNLIHQIVLAKTEKDSVAFKYDGGLTGLPIQPESKVVWRDLSNRTQQFEFGSPASGSVTVWNTNRVIAAELKGGSIAVFPTPHSFYWARESSQNLGYGWYRKDSETAFSLGVRQAENEQDPEFYHNYTLYSARPGTWQRLPVFLYVTPETNGVAALDAALTFTRGDRFKPLPGFQVMGSHYHVGFVDRLEESGSMDTRINDIDAAKGIGINIYGIIDSAGRNRLEGQEKYFDAARKHSDKTFLIMPNEELTGGPMALELGGHSDIMVSKPVYWLAKRSPGQPLFEENPKYGRVYNLGTAADMVEMTKLENAVIYEPHPRSKGSTGFPDAIKDKPHFLADNFRGLGYRWGMGIDASEVRLGQYRVLDLWDEMNNWIADRPLQPKYLQAISEARSDIGERGRPSFDDNYGMSPVNYMKIGALPKVDDMSSIINAMKAGNYFVTSGEVLISNYALEGKGDQRTITADVEWTFPLNFVEVVWGDGQKTDRQIISAADLPAFGKKHFSIPFNAAGKKWVRFAVWDIATNGAFVQPIKLNGAAQ